MKLSTRGRYGLKAMFDLAMHYGDGPVSLTVISDRQVISTNYLEQLMTLLKRAKLVDSVRGAQGGYFLSKAPEEITVAAVLTALEGSLAPTDCVKNEQYEGKYCVTKSIYEKLYEGINKVVENITLQDMCDDYNKNCIVEDICDCK